MKHSLVVICIFICIGAARAQFSPVSGTNNIYTEDGVIIGSAQDLSSFPQKLIVENEIITEKVVVKNEIDWPDYVFEPSYKLDHPDSLVMFIEAYGHLPDMPDSDMIRKNGIEIAGFQSKLLKKIEELTLYVLELNKNIDTLEKEIENIRNKKLAK
jgi:hypothetical protein